MHKQLTSVMLVHSPQTTFHRRIIYNFVWIYLSRSSRPDVFCKKGVLRNIAKLTGKHLCQSLFFNKVAGLCKKRDYGTGVFSEFVKFLKTPFLQNSSGGCFCLGQHCIRKLPVKCWPMAKVQRLCRR